jgi:hypothetical protein
MGKEASAKVIHKVARKKEIDPEELKPLYTAINPDALNTIFESEEHTGTVVFSYMDYDIIVASNGKVTIE